MRQKVIKKLGYVLVNPMRKKILNYLVNPDKTPKTFSQIQNGVSTDMEKPITDGSLGWYLKDLQANVIIKKENKKYTPTESGEEIHKIIEMIDGEARE